MGGIDGTCKQVSTMWETAFRDARSLFHAFAHVGGCFWAGKNIFGFRVFNYTYWALVRAPGWVWWDGLQWMGLDDDFPIRNLLPFRDVRIAWGSGLLLGMGFHSKKKVSISS